MMAVRGLELREPLTQRETEVFLLLVNSPYTQPEIGRELRISLRMVAYHVGNVYRKFGLAPGSGNHRSRYVLMDSFRNKARISWEVLVRKNKRARLGE